MSGAKEQLESCELNIDRISSWILLNLYAQIMDVPEVHDPCQKLSCSVVSKSSVDRSGVNDRTIRYSQRKESASEMPRIVPYLEETAHLIHNIANEEVAHFSSSNSKEFFADCHTSAERNDAYKRNRRDMNMLEFFAKLASMQFLLRKDMQEELAHIIGTKRYKSLGVIEQLIYTMERSNCEALPFRRVYVESFGLLVRPPENLAYLEAYLLLTEFSDEQIQIAPLAELIRLPIDQLRSWAYTAVGSKKAERIHTEFEQILSEEADTGFWQFQN